MHIGKSEEVFQYGYQSIDFVAHTRTPGDVDIRQILGYLGSIYIDFFGYLCRRDVPFAPLLEQLNIRQVPRQPAQSRLRHFHAILILNCLVRGHFLHFFRLRVDKNTLFLEKNTPTEES